VLFIGVIYHYGIDSGHSFLKSMDPTRYNLVLSAFFWAAAMLKDGISSLGDAFPLVYKFVCAWLESVQDDGNFTDRIDFLSEWQFGHFDLTWFTSANKKKMRAALTKLEISLPPLEGDSAEFMEKCRLGLIDQQEFRRVGPAMSLHFLLAKERKAREEAAERKRIEKEAEEAELERKAANLEVLLSKKEIEDSENRRADAMETLWHSRGMQMLIEEGAKVTVHDEQRLKQMVIELEDEGEIEVEFSDEEEEEDDAMDVEDAGYPVPLGVDLTRVAWDGPLLQALLGVDTSIMPHARPESVRKAWISQADGMSILWNEVDELAEGLAKLMKSE
jgi:hypothetical protein